MEVKEKGEDGEECVRACVCSMRVSGADQSAQLLGYRSSSDDDDRMKGEKRGGCARSTEGCGCSDGTFQFSLRRQGAPEGPPQTWSRLGPRHLHAPLHVHELQEHVQHCTVGRGPERRRRPC